MNVRKEITARLARYIGGKREELIRAAINYKIGHDHWTLEDINKRGNFMIYPNGDEVFQFDGEDLILFPFRFGVTENIDFEMHVKDLLPYKLLYPGISH